MLKQIETVVAVITDSFTAPAVVEAVVITIAVAVADKVMKKVMGDA